MATPLASDAGGVPLVAIAGLSGSGKTRLLSRLTWGWRRERLTVATIKHTRHSHPLDRPGSDTELHRAAGAAATLLVGPSGWVLQGGPDSAPPTQAGPAAEWLRAFLTARGRPPQRILLEGYKSDLVPHIWVAGAEEAISDPLSLPPQTLAVVVREAPASGQWHCDLPAFWAENSSGLASWLDQRWGVAPPALPLTAAVFVGGQSRRMGRNKAFLEVGGVPLLERVLWSVRSAAETLLVTADATPYRGWGRPTVAERLPGQGPLTALEAALQAARQPFVAALACDMPFLAPFCLRTLHQALTQAPQAAAAVAVSGGRRHPLCALYRRDLLGRLTAALAGGARSFDEFLASLNVCEVAVPGLWTANLNTEADLAWARALAADADAAAADELAVPGPSA